MKKELQSISYVLLFLMVGINLSASSQCSGCEKVIDNIWLDHSVQDSKALMLSISTDIEERSGDFHLFTHGRSGELLIENQWLSGNSLLDFLKTKITNQTQYINIYGCEFAKGEKGKLAVSEIEEALGVSVSASDDITGIDGDWELEVGLFQTFDFNYAFNLQTGPNDDFDNDGVINSADLDDDNDGVTDLDESVCAEILLDPDPNSNQYLNSGNFSGLNSPQLTSTSSWSGVSNSAPNQFVGMLFDGVPYGVKGITIAGRADFATQWVSNFDLQGTMDGNTWQTIGNYDGNTDNDTPVFIETGNHQSWLGVRIVPVAWNVHPSLRFQITLEEVCDADTDGDTVLNKFDLDSDDDGCSDAYEANATNFITPNYQFPDVDSNNDGLVDVVDSDEDGVIDYNSTYSPNAIDETVISCLPSCNDANLYEENCDLDGDGILNIDDLDDDNDGILDTDECPDLVSPLLSLIANYDGAFNTNTLGSDFINYHFHNIYSTVDINLTGGLFDELGGQNLTSGGTFNIRQDSDIQALDLLVSQVYENTDYEFSFDVMGDDANMTSNHLVVELYDTTIDSQVEVLYDDDIQDAPLNSPKTISATFQLPDSTHNYVIRWYGLGVGNEDFDYKLDRIALALNKASNILAFCDTDGDGIPNLLDLDSDGDGCPDAIEGGGTFTNSDLVNSGIPGGNADTGDGLYNGTSMDPIDSNLGNVVDENGSPIAGDPAIAVTQDIGSSQDVNINTCPTLETNAENDINQTPEGVPVDGNVLTNDNDPTGDTQMVTSVMGGLDATGAPLTIPTDGTPTTIYEEDPDAPGTYVPVGEIEFNADGSYTFTPADGFSGDVPTLTYEITDSTGATDTATLDIDVIPVDDPEMNDVPVANDDTNTTDQGVAVEGGLLGNDSDPDGDMLTVTTITIGGVDYPVDSATGSGEIMIPGVGTIEVAADGTYTFTPDPDFVGDVPPIGYTVEDPSGESADAVLAIEVVADPDGMSNNTYANDDSSVGESGAAQSTNLISNDNDPEGEDQTIQSVTVFDMSGMPVVVTDFTAAVNVYDEEGNLTGTLMVDPLTGDVTFTPEPGFVGTIPIEYTVVDTDGNTDTATYYPTVLAPLETNAENDINQTPEGVPVDGNVLTNDNDPTGDAQTVTSVMGGLDAAGAPLTIPTDGTPTTIYEEDPDAPGTYIAVGEIEFNADGSYTFTPEDGFSGDVPTLTYEITDSTGATDTATLGLNVIPLDVPAANDVPIANDDTNTTDQGVAVEGGLLGNDSDPDGDMLTVTTITIDGVDYPVDPATGSGEIMIPGVGTIEVAADGTYTFTPDPDFVGDVPPIGYTVEDPSGESADAVLAIEVVADPDGMSNNTYANDDSSVGESGAAQSTNLISNDNDPEGEDQTIQSVTVFDMSGLPVVVTDFLEPVNVYDENGTLLGALVVNPLTGDVTFTPETDFVGTIPIEYTAVDTDGNTDTATYYPTTLPEVVDLPIELYSFRVSKQGENGLLNWSTSSELNNEYFMVERSVDGIRFESIGRVEGAGTTNQKQDYSFTDRETVKGVNYYRLNQFDYDGESSYSPIRTIEFGDAGTGDDIGVNLYPNPVYDKVSITSTKDIKDHKLMVYNVIGQVMTDGAFVSGMELDMTSYEPGVYMLQIVDQEGNVLKSDRLVKL